MSEKTKTGNGAEGAKTLRNGGGKRKSRDDIRDEIYGWELYVEILSRSVRFERVSVDNGDPDVRVTLIECALEESEAKKLADYCRQMSRIYRESISRRQP